MKLSLIIPIYNIDKYLDKCLNSISTQKNKDIEIILVNDGSTDKSLSICERYKKKDKRIKIINQENQGLSAARNVGLKYANGEFIWFIDGDDYIEDGSVERIMSLLNVENDIIVFNYNKVKNGKIIKMKGYYNFDKIDTKYVLAFPSVWNKIFRKSILEVDLFPEGHVYEDLYAVPNLILRTKNIVFIEDFLYNYQHFL